MVLCFSHMRYFGTLLLILCVFSSCGREKITDNIDSYLQGKWQVNNARFQAFGDGRGSREIHEYDQAGISFMSGNQISIQLADNSKQNGSYKIQTNDRSYYNLHLDIWNKDSTELRKEIWYITGGNGKKWRAEIETKEGWVNFQGVRQ